MNDIQSVIKKIKALHARAADKATTEAEAEIAMRVAGDLLKKHNITLTEVDVKADGVAKETWGGGKHRLPEAFAARGIEAFCNVKIWRNGGVMTIIGSPADSAAAAYFFDIVANAVKSAFERYRKSIEYAVLVNQTGSARGVGTSFRIGVASRLGQRLSAMAREGEQVTPSANGNALVVVKNAMINDYMRDNGIKLYKATNTNLRSGSAFASGKEAANNVNLNRGIGGSRAAAYLN